MTWWRRKLRGFYSVLDRDDVGLARALLASSRVMQVRKKPATRGELLAIARTAREVTALLGKTLIINDDLHLAHEVGADGVHLGQTDMSLAEARHRTDLIIGVSTHDLDQLQAAVSGGADYVAFGPVLPTKSKSNPDPVVGFDGLAAAVELAGDVPVVAIGGLTGAHAQRVHDCGAAALCAISWVNNAADPGARARELNAPWGIVRTS